MKSVHKLSVIFLILIGVFIIVHQVTFFLYPINLGIYGNRGCPIGTINVNTLRQNEKTEGIRNTGLPQNKMCVSYVGYLIENFTK